MTIANYFIITEIGEVLDSYKSGEIEQPECLQKVIALLEKLQKGAT